MGKKEQVPALAIFVQGSLLGVGTRRVVLTSFDVFGLGLNETVIRVCAARRYR